MGPFRQDTATISEIFWERACLQQPEVSPPKYIWTPNFAVFNLSALTRGQFALAPSCLLSHSQLRHIMATFDDAYNDMNKDKTVLVTHYNTVKCMVKALWSTVKTAKNRMSSSSSSCIQMHSDACLANDTVIPPTIGVKVIALWAIYLCKSKLRVGGCVCVCVCVCVLER